ncbi:MAG: RrF2 family transcriptional regulator [Planctomycetota bacterium]|jgi:Rrf2 family protein
MIYPYFQISKKSDYAIRALFELALRGPSEPVNVRSLAKAQGIPTRFLEIILNELKQGGFVVSTRGKAGGYKLSTSADAINIGQIIRFLEKHTGSESDNGDHIERLGDYTTDHIMGRINQSISDICEATSLKDMVEEEMKHQNAFVGTYVI